MEWTVAVGVDTHKDVQVAVALDALGVQLDSREIAATAAGYRSLLCWAQEFGVPAFAIEGTGSYGAGLVRFLERAGVNVYECERPRRQERRRGKSDLIDAALAARRLLGFGPAARSSTVFCGGSAGASSDSRARWQRPSMLSPRSSPKSRPRCSRSAA